MLRVVHGNSIERLADALIEALPSPPDVFAPRTIVVDNRLLGRWLELRLALRTGIAAGYRQISLERLLLDAYLDEGRGLVALGNPQLAHLLASVLAEPARDGDLALAPALGYVGDDDGKRLQLADRLADQLWQYAQTRPDWFHPVAARQLELRPELADDDPAAAHAGWQAGLWRSAQRRLTTAQPDKVHAPIPLLPRVRRQLGLPTPVLPGPVACFGLTRLTAATLEALSDLALHADITVYLVSPTAELPLARDEVLTDERGPSAALLERWNRPTRDAISALLDAAAGNFEEAFVDPTGRADTGLARVVRELAGGGAPLREPAPASTDGVTLRACPNPRRELEEVATQIRELLRRDPERAAYRTAVLIAPADAATYMALVPSVFGHAELPFHQIGISSAVGSAASFLDALLALAGSPLTRRDVLPVIGHLAVTAGLHRHGDDGEGDDAWLAWAGWLDELGVVRGEDDADFRATYLGAAPQRFHWSQGLRRLALGAVLAPPGPATGQTPAPIGDAARRWLPHHLGDDHRTSAATLAVLARAAIADARRLAGTRVAARGWATLLRAMLDRYLPDRLELAPADLDHVRAIVGELAELDLDGRPLELVEVRHRLTGALTATSTERGAVLTHGVLIAPLALARGLPCDDCFVVGLGETEFPASTQPHGLDLRTVARRGDLTPRQRDLQSFLDLLLAVRGTLHLSYQTGADPNAAEAAQPSIVVEELRAALAPHGDAATLPSVPIARFPWRDAAPDQPLVAQAELPAIRSARAGEASYQRLTAAVRERGLAVPDADDLARWLSDLAAARAQPAALTDTGIPSAHLRTVSPARLRTFLESPVQAWAKLVLQLDDDEAAADSITDEPLVTTALDRTPMLRAALIAGAGQPSADLATSYDALVARQALSSRLPVGVFAEAQRADDLALLETWASHVADLGALRPTTFGAERPDALGMPAIDLEVEVAGVATPVRVSGTGELRAADGTGVVLRAGKRGQADYVRAGIDAALRAITDAAQAPITYRYRIVAGEGKPTSVSCAWSAADAQGYLGALIRELLAADHAYVLPLDALVSALAGEVKAIDLESQHHDPLGWGPVREHWGLAIPSSDASQELAHRRLGPLAARLCNDKGPVFVVASEATP